MLKFLPLIVSALRRKPLRTLLTILSITVAFALFGFLESFRFGLAAAITSMDDDRLVTVSKGGNRALPLSYLEHIQRIPDVVAASGFVYIPISLPPGRTVVGALAVEPGELLKLYPALRLTPEEKERWLSLRTGALVGQAMATRQGWKKGDLVALPAAAHVKRDGTRDWPVTIVALIQPLTGGTGNDLYLHYDYFNESVAGPNNNLAYVMSRVTQASKAETVRDAIDGPLTNSSAPTKTTSLKAYVRRGITQLGNVGAVILAVIGVSFFTMLLITASTMGQSVRDRASEFAVMKTIGFTNLGISGLVVAEALLMSAIGSATALAAVISIGSAAAKAGQDLLPVVYGHLLSASLLLIVGCAAAACVLPLGQVWRESIVEGLRHE